MNDEHALKIEYCMQLLGEVIEINDQGGFNDFRYPPDNIKYAHLMAILQLRDEVEGIEELYFSLYNFAVSAGKYSVAKKAADGEKIRVYFLLYSASQWSVDSLYNIIKDDSRFDVKIVLAPLVERPIEDSLNIYNASKKYFDQRGYDYVDSFDASTMTVLTWEAVGGVPDLLIHLSSWNEGMPDSYDIAALPINTLNVYIPYDMYTVDSPDGNFMRKMVYDKPFMNLMWQIFMHFEQDKNDYEKYGFLQGSNVTVTGYPKMDKIVFPRDYTEKDISALWKIPAGRLPNEMKKVIISPHYTLLYGGEILSLSTFHENAYYLLYLAEKYMDKVSFIFKPHPNLRYYSVKTGFMSDYEQYDNYITAWNNLPNARVVGESEYTEWFATSDGCINDSGSFLMEYQFTGKPMLYLKKKSQRLRSGIEVLEKSVYNVSGIDYMGIERFLNDVVIKGEDTLASKRKVMFEGPLKYDFEKPAGVKIYHIICDLFNENL